MSCKNIQRRYFSKRLKDAISKKFGVIAIYIFYDRFLICFLGRNVSEIDLFHGNTPIFHDLCVVENIWLSNVVITESP